MFVKIVTENKELMYECVKTEQNTGDNEHSLLLTIFNRDGSQETLDLDKRTVMVYFMNEEGKTVDRVTCR